MSDKLQRDKIGMIMTRSHITKIVPLYTLLHKYNFNSTSKECLKEKSQKKVLKLSYTFLISVWHQFSFECSKVYKDVSVCHHSRINQFYYEKLFLCAFGNISSVF